MRIAIIGLGLIGGSLGLAMRGVGLEVVGFARRPEVASSALDLGAVGRVENSALAAVSGADVIVIATPAMAVEDVMAEIADGLGDGAIVTDTASTKVSVMGWAEEALPPSVRFIGGHPMAGKETSGIAAADSALFKGCTYCLVKGSGANDEAVATLDGLVRRIGATPLLIEAAEHDELVAGISHLPLLISVALVGATTESPLWPAMARLAASGYRDLSRLASGDPRMGRDICLTNAGPILRWMDRYIEELNALRRLIEEGAEGGLEQALARAREGREDWLGTEGGG